MSLNSKYVVLDYTHILYYLYYYYILELLKNFILQKQFLFWFIISINYYGTDIKTYKVDQLQT